MLQLTHTFNHSELEFKPINDFTVYMWEDLVIPVNINNYNPRHEGSFKINITNVPSSISFIYENSSLTGQSMLNWIYFTCIEIFIYLYITVLIVVNSNQTAGIQLGAANSTTFTGISASLILNDGTVVSSFTFSITVAGNFYLSSLFLSFLTFFQPALLEKLYAEIKHVL